MGLILEAYLELLASHTVLGMPLCTCVLGVVTLTISAPTFNTHISL